MTSEIVMLQNEIDRGDQTELRPGMRSSLHIAWSPYNEAWRGKVAISRGYISYAEREARRMFYSYIAGRDITTSDDLTSGEALRLMRWLMGDHPAPGIATDPRMREQRKLMRIEEVTEWLASKDNKALTGARAQSARSRAKMERVRAAAGATP